MADDVAGAGVAVAVGALLGAALGAALGTSGGCAALPPDGGLAALGAVTAGAAGVAGEGVAATPNRARYQTTCSGLSGADQAGSDKLNNKAGNKCRPMLDMIGVVSLSDAGFIWAHRRVMRCGRDGLNEAYGLFGSQGEGEAHV